MILDLDARTLDGKPVTEMQCRIVARMASVKAGRCSIDRLIAAVYCDRDEPGNAAGSIQTMICKLHKKVGPVMRGNPNGSGYELLQPITVRSSLPPAAIPGELVAPLRSILYASRAPSADRLLEVIGG